MRLAEQARYGRLIFGAVMLLFIVTILISWVETPQTLTLNGAYIRDNSRVFARFLESVKAHDGVLIIGTSETNAHLNGQNYWMMLNRDRDVNPHFSVLSGAGRCSYVWFPAILANQKAFRGLRVLYFLNPTYWRESLNRFDTHYFERYNSRRLVESIVPEAEANGLMPFIAPYLSAQVPPEPSKGWINEWFGNFHSYYSYDLKQVISGRMPNKDRSYESPSPERIWMWQYGLDLENNVSLDYGIKHPNQGIVPVSSSEFQYRALHSFIFLAKRVGIELTVFVGPYNGIAARKYSPEVLSGYERTVSRILRILDDTRTPYINGADLSYNEGVFIDAQHHSAYGAWQIERKVAAFYRN